MLIGFNGRSNTLGKVSLQPFQILNALNLYVTLNVTLRSKSCIALSILIANQDRQGHDGSLDFQAPGGWLGNRVGFAKPDQSSPDIGSSAATGYSVADVSLRADVKRVMAEAITALGGLDCLALMPVVRQPLPSKRLAMRTGIPPINSI